MKKLFFTLVFLFFVYFGIQTLFYFLGPGHDVDYEVSGYDIKEKYANHQKLEIQNYFFEITKNEKVFNLQILEDFNRDEKIIEEIKEFNSDNLNCILPIFKEKKVLTDLLCLQNGIIYNYQELQGKNPSLDAFYQEISQLISKENLADYDTKGSIVLYKDNIPNNYYLSFESYKGFIYANYFDKEMFSKNIFQKDVYDNYLSAYVGKYYVTVNYDEQYDYTNIYIYNIINPKEEKIVLTTSLDKNSYIEGVADKKLYIFDVDNKKQYEINPETLKILEVGNVTTGTKIYKNNKWERVSAYECAKEKILFDYENNDKNLDNYIYLAETGGTKSGYTYYYRKNNDEYMIFRTNKQKLQYVYLFTTKYLNKIIPINEYVFFADDYYIKYYSDATGIRTLLSNTELYFNQNLEFQIFYSE